MEHVPSSSVSPLPLELALEQYKAQFLTSRNLAERTRKEYVTDLADLITFLIQHALLKTVSQVSKFHLEQYLAKLDGRGLKGSSRRRKVASIRSFFIFLADHGLVAVNPALKLVPPEREHTQPRVLSENEYKRLLDAVRFEVRDAALIEVLLQTGMRLSELANLTISQVQLPVKVSRDPGNVGSVTILGKGRKTRTVTLNWKACKALKLYLANRPPSEFSQIFLTKFERPMRPRAIERAVEKHLKEASIHGASVHTLRHTFATHMVRKGTKLDVVRQALGHSSLKTTSIYVELARDVMDKELQENAL